MACVCRDCQIPDDDTCFFDVAKLLIAYQYGDNVDVFNDFLKHCHFISKLNPASEISLWTALKVGNK